MANPIYLAFGDAPQAILSVMDGLRLREQQQALQEEQYRQRIAQRTWLPWLLFVLGIGAFGLDVVLGFRTSLFALVGIFFWVAALVTAKAIYGLQRLASWLAWFPWFTLLVGLIWLMVVLWADRLGPIGDIWFQLRLVFLFGIGVIGAVLIWSRLRRYNVGSPRQPVAFPAHFETIRTVIQTLRDDVANGGSFAGHLDLTGLRRPEKRMQQRPDARGRAVEYYRDEWFRLKSKLYDGNLLRISAVESTRVRNAYRKRSRSGKMKHKPEKVKNHLQELRVRVAYNPQVYHLAPTSTAQPGTRIGQYQIVEIDSSDGMLNILAQAGRTTIQASDMLGVLRFAYDQLQRRSGS
ncbi:MAG: hypothetical protein HC837_02780 [Chloroflexaceae bacterium]|nr:hypothetical protein [Chloroflexaceae bacterium]